MDHKGFAGEIGGAESGRHHAGGCAAVVVDHKPAQVAAVPIAEGAEMGAAVVGIPVATSRQSGHRNALCIEACITAVVGMEVKAVLSRRQAAEAGDDFQALVAVASRHAADRFANAVGTDALDRDLQAGGLRRVWPNQRDAHQQHCEQATHVNRAEGLHSAPDQG